jgi:subtilisin family serine protease
LFFTHQSFNRLTANSGDIVLSWADPLGASANDYDLFILNAAGTTVLGSSTTRQNGSSDPVEECYSATGFPANSCIVIVLHSGSACALFLNVFFGSTLSIVTAGNTLGHVAAQNSLTVAGSYWDSAHTGTRPFNGTNNPTEAFSADGPRRVFFNPNGTAITPGNFLFATGGGIELQKPELTGADGVMCKTPGFQPLTGTSAAAAHVAGVAALVKSAKPSLTGAQIRQILISTAMDNMEPGPDLNGGYGVVNAQAAVQAALTQ